MKKSAKKQRTAPASRTRLQGPGQPRRPKTARLSPPSPQAEQLVAAAENIFGKTHRLDRQADALHASIHQTQEVVSALHGGVAGLPPAAEAPAIVVVDQPPVKVKPFPMVGIGIEPRNLGRIFGIFERIHAPEEFEGTGIGLAIVRKAAERMGGSVGMESEPGKGSAFWLQLKAPPPPSERPLL